MKFIYKQCCRNFLISVLIMPAFVPNVFADEFAPALLQITERDGGWVEVTWKIPTRKNRRIGLTPILPSFLKPIGQTTGKQWTDAWVEHSTYQSNGRTLAGELISINGLGPIQNDVLIRIALQDGSQHSTILRAGYTSYIIPERAGKAEVATSYWNMGTIHILKGVDHLLFVTALLLIVVGYMPLFKAVTAFTVAHSITLVMATLGIVRVPSAPTEAIIALSILFLATEIIRQRNGEIGLTERYPWLIAFIFGLFHGLGFAGALSEIGVPQHEVPLALLMFNVGVETGQLLFIAAALGLLGLLRRTHVTLPQKLWYVLPYGIGSVAAFWSIERVMSFTPY